MEAVFSSETYTQVHTALQPRRRTRPDHFHLTPLGVRVHLSAGHATEIIVSASLATTLLAVELKVILKGEQRAFINSQQLAVRPTKAWFNFASLYVCMYVRLLFVRRHYLTRLVFVLRLIEY
jgi:hypothetical protein